MSRNVYQVIVNCSNVVFEDVNKKSCLLRALRFASDKSNYVELWYVFSDGKRCLVKYWNCFLGC